MQQLEKDLESEGSDLAGVNADFTFKEIPKVNSPKALNHFEVTQFLLTDENQNGIRFGDVGHKVFVEREQRAATGGPFHQN